MFHRFSLGAPLRALVLGGCVTLVGSLLPSLATAASTPPVSSTSCNGTLSRAPTKDEPNLLSYKFHCDWGITAYTVIATRKPSDFSTLDDFSPTASVVDTSGNVVPTVGLACNGVLPGNGVNCAVAPKTYVAAPDFAEGTIDTSDPYCANVPKRTKTARPQAIVQLVVTDTHGAQDGPFRLGLHPGCVGTSKTKAKHRARGRHHAHRRISKLNR